MPEDNPTSKPSPVALSLTKSGELRDNLGFTRSQWTCDVITQVSLPKSIVRVKSIRIDDGQDILLCHQHYGSRPLEHRCPLILPDVSAPTAFLTCYTSGVPEPASLGRDWPSSRFSSARGGRSSLRKLFRLGQRRHPYRTRHAPTLETCPAQRKAVTIPAPPSLHRGRSPPLPILPLGWPVSH